MTMLIFPFQKKENQPFILSLQRTARFPYSTALNPPSPILLTILFPQPWNEFLWWDDANLLLLRSNAVEKVCQACQQVFLLFLLGLVCQHILTERPAEVQCLKHGVTVACVSKLPKHKKSGLNHSLGTSHLWNGGWPGAMNLPRLPKFPYIGI